MPSVAPTTAAPAAGPATTRAPLRMFGRFNLLRLLGKSQRTMAWVVGDPQSGRDLILVLPRTQLADRAAGQRWAQAVHKAARLQHPRLASALEIGAHEGWPFAAYDAAGWSTWSDCIGNTAQAAPEAVAIAAKALDGLAYAHEAGIAHHDLQPYMVLVGDAGGVCLIGMEVAVDDGGHGARGQSGVELQALRAQRESAERDVLALGLILHLALTGQAALDERDVGQVIDRLPPAGHEIVRLPWATPQPVPEALRAIANRATDRQERQRYRSARTLARALEGWLSSDEKNGDGPLALLLDRMAKVGLLPGSSGGAERTARLARMDRQRTNELAAVIIDDLALAFELLRLVNGALQRSGGAVGAGPVLTVRRAIAMLGMDGLRRTAATLRPWPGPLAPEAAKELERMLARVRQAGRVAVALGPAGYDAEVIYMLAQLQNLGRLVVQYHCADEAQQIRRLMQQAPPEHAGEAPQPGMLEDAAALTVLGVDIESIGVAVARRLGLDEDWLLVVRRCPVHLPVRTPESDHEQLRTVASCANELLDLQLLPPAQQGQALQRIAQRYSRALHVTPKDLQAALQDTARTGTIDVLTAASGNAFFTAPPIELDSEPLGPQ